MAAGGTVHITEAWLTAETARPLPDGAAQLEYRDTRMVGFGVIVGRKGATFFVQRRVGGRRKMVTIGRYGHPGAGADHSERWTVKRAREEAERLVGSMSSGVDPRPRNPAIDKTLRDAFEAHIERLERKGRAAATIATFKKSMPYLEAVLDRPIAELDGEVLTKVYESIKAKARPMAGAKNARGAPLANRVITNVGTAWESLNRKLGGKLGTWNPAKAVEKEALQPKRSRIPDELLPDWYARVQSMRNPIQRDGLVFALFTGLRSEDVRASRREHVNAKAKTLALPDPKGGEGRAFAIPLPKTCLQIVERRKKDNAHDLARDAGDDGWLFPAVDSDGEVGPIGDLRQQVHGDKHARFPAESVHDLRRTYLSVAQEAGISELDRHVLTNHSFASHNVNATYIAQHIGHLAKCQAKIEAALWRKIKGRSR